MVDTWGQGAGSRALSWGPPFPRWCFGKEGVQEWGAHQLVDLGERGILDVQAVCGDPVQGCVVQHHLGGQKRVTDLGGQKGQELCLVLHGQKDPSRRLEQDWGTGRFKTGVLNMNEKDELDRGVGSGVSETPGLTTQSAFWVSLLSVSSEL